MIRNNEDTGVSNPYALAEFISGRKIKWNKIANKSRLLERIFGMPFERIIHPNSGSPIFYVFKKIWKLEAMDEKGGSWEGTFPNNDFDLSNRMLRMHTLGELKQIFDMQNLEQLPVQQAQMAQIVNKNVLRIDICLPSRLPEMKQDSEAGRSMISFLETIAGEEDPADPWNPSNASWGGSGSFFYEAAEFSDPIQGVVGDCYLIAALTSVAWARPFDISHRTRAIGTDQSEYVNLVEFHEEDGSIAKIEVTSTVPILNSTNSPFCSRSSEAGEIWPAIIEKAYAKWRTGHVGDKPNIGKIAGGSPFVAIQQITCLQEWHHPTKDHTADELWDQVRENSLSKRTFNPMVACTSSEFLINQDGGTYVGTGIVPGHAYSILGWDYRNGTKYIILRNPWGYQEPSIGALSGRVIAYDISWWRRIELASDDGVFGIEADLFKTYFNYLGGAKEP